MPSRAAERRARKRARDDEGAPAAPAPTIDAPLAAPAPRAVVPAAAPSTVREWTMPMPSADSDLHEAIELARVQASTITGRKYRYGAVLLADDVVLRADT